MVVDREHGGPVHPWDSKRRESPQPFGRPGVERDDGCEVTDAGWQERGWDQQLGTRQEAQALRKAERQRARVEADQRIAARLPHRHRQRERRAERVTVGLDMAHAKNGRTVGYRCRDGG